MKNFFPPAANVSPIDISVILPTAFLCKLRLLILIHNLNIFNNTIAVIINNEVICVIGFPNVAPHSRSVSPSKSSNGQKYQFGIG